MRYEKPVLTLVGSAASIVLGTSYKGVLDSYPESDLRKYGDVDEGLD
jgi:hypothetical protein